MGKIMVVCFFIDSQCSTPSLLPWQPSLFNI